MYVAEHGSDGLARDRAVARRRRRGWMWTPQVEALRDTYRLLVPDLPGQGRSTDGGRFTMPAAAEQVADLIRSKGRGSRARRRALRGRAGRRAAPRDRARDWCETAVVSSALVHPIPGRGVGVESGGCCGGATARPSRRLRNVDWWIRLNMRSAAGVPDAYFDEFRESFRTLSEDGFVDLMVANQAFRLPAGLDRVRRRACSRCAARGSTTVMKRSTADIAAAIPGAVAREVRHATRMSLAQQHNWNMTAPRPVHRRRSATGSRTVRCHRHCSRSAEQIAVSARARSPSGRGEPAGP